MDNLASVTGNYRTHQQRGQYVVVLIFTILLLPTLEPDYHFL
jgi:hypothetical protein